ncbi:MAG: class I SAM-dependent methyltransferase [Verrucomicrobiae bacterium]|nr:class I SAM-dependent methyltransferase [Verrucomicrobiae bacterium]
MIKTDDSLIPSEILMTTQFIGHTTKEMFVEKGDELFELFCKNSDITPNAKVLDVGCGLGRLARPFARYLSGCGEYWGVDVEKTSIEWCKDRYGKRFMNFHFSHINVYNKSYNPTVEKTELPFKFAFEENTFDFVFALSVFTHMHSRDISQYMWEVGRILKPGKSFICTWFLLNTESKSNLKMGLSREDFKYEIPDGLTKNRETPEIGMAYPEELVRKFYEKSHLTIRDPIRYGLWSGRKDFFRYQDFVFASKTG